MKEGDEIDRISNLPGHITDQILSCSSLTLRDAVRTSILSRKWRYKWVTLPCIVFDRKSVSLSTLAQTLTLRKSKLVAIIDRFLLLHAGPIHKFKLAHRYIEGGSSDIDRWILYLSRGGAVKEFTLHILEGGQYKVPSSMYSCQKLTHLELNKCVLRPPPEFNGFNSLKCLDLQNTTMEQLGFEQMISSCPLLESLTFKNFDGFTLLNIHAPNLLYLDVVGQAFEDISLQKTFNLTVVSISFDYYLWILTHLSSDNLIHFFTSLPHIQRLMVKHSFLKYLADGDIPEKLPSACLHLTFLSIDIHFNDTKENLAVLCLLRSSPNLQELELHGLSDSEEQDPATATSSDFASFRWNQLRLIKIVGICSLRREVSFIKLLLENSPFLQSMTVQPASLDGGFERILLKELLLIRRASTSS